MRLKNHSSSKHNGSAPLNARASTVNRPRAPRVRFAAPSVRQSTGCHREWLWPLVMLRATPQFRRAPTCSPVRFDRSTIALAVWYGVQPNAQKTPSLDQIAQMCVQCLYLPMAPDYRSASALVEFGPGRARRTRYLGWILGIRE